MNKIKKLSIAFLVLVMMALLCVPAFADDWSVTCTGITSDAGGLCVGNAPEAQFSVSFSLVDTIELFSFDAYIELPDGWKITAFENEGLNLDINNYDANTGRILWYQDLESAEDINVETKLLGKFKVEIPTQVSAGTYAIKIKDIELAKITGFDPSTETVTTDVAYPADITVEVTIYPHSYYLDTTKGTNGYAWAENGSACTAYGKCSSCKGEITDDATVAYKVTTPATCTVMGTTTYTATFTEVWATTQTKEVQDVAVDANAHAYPSAPSGYDFTDETHTAYYTCGLNSEHKKYDAAEGHDYTLEDGTKCVCGAVKPVTNISVVHKGNALASAYTVDGQVVTVTYSLACKVGYYDATAGKYVAITATKVADNCYSFTAPEGVTEVLLVVKGDVNGNGSVNVLDKNMLGKSILPKANANYQALNEAWQVFAADVNGNGSVNVLDKNTLGKSILPKANANYQALTW